MDTRFDRSLAQTKEAPASSRITLSLEGDEGVESWHQTSETKQGNTSEKAHGAFG